MTTPAPIGLSGFAQSGKTTAANYIEQQFGYRRQHIAEPLRRMLASLLSDFGMKSEYIERYLVGDWKEHVIPELGITSRQAQITLGTEWGRDLVNPNLWSKLWRSMAEVAWSLGTAVMNDSVRFPNEETAIRRMGGVTILITRPGTGPAAFKWKRVGPLLYRWFGCFWGVHDSERVDRLMPDYTVVNDGTLFQLEEKISTIVSRVIAATEVST